MNAYHERHTMLTQHDLIDWMREFRIPRRYFRPYWNLFYTGKVTRRLERMIRADQRFRDLMELLIVERLGTRCPIVRTALRFGISL